MVATMPYIIYFNISSPIPILYPVDKNTIFPYLSATTTTGRFISVDKLNLRLYFKTVSLSSLPKNVLSGMPFILTLSKSGASDKKRNLPPHLSNSGFRSGRSLKICLVGSFSGSIHKITIPLSGEHACEVLLAG